MTRLHVAIADDDGADLFSVLPRCVSFIDDAKARGGRVLLHCVAGRSRAPAIAAAYLMLNNAESGGTPLTAADALQRIEAVRPWVEVRPSLVAQLETLEVRIRGAPHGDAKRVAEAIAGLAISASSPAGPAVEGSPPSESAAPTAEATGEEAAASAAAAKRAARERAAAQDGSVLEEADDLPWVTVENLKQTQRSDPMRRAAEIDASTKVACLTTDYAMQSVLMQMGLKLMGADGMLMRSVKQWVLRCSGCFTLQPSIDRDFCIKCGNSSLVRLIAIIDAHGARRVLPETGAPARVRSTNVRGTKYPMPQPKSGRHAKNLILAEDQLQEANEKFRKQGKARVENVFDPDYSLDDHFGRAGKKSAVGQNAPKAGYGKRANPNDVRSRSKRT